MRNNRARVPRSVLVTALVAVLVLVAALVTVAGVRRHHDSPVPPGAGADVPAGGQQSTSQCGPDPCVQLTALTVSGTTMVLLGDRNGGSGRLRIGPESANVTLEMTITTIGARLGADSLRCAVATISTCLVRGVTEGGMVGEVLSGRGTNWRTADKPYFSDAGTISLSDVTGDGLPDVIVVRHECPGDQPGSPKCAAAPVLASVFNLAGVPLGCTKKYASPSQLRGWPDVRLAKTDLRACP